MAVRQRSSQQILPNEVYEWGFMPEKEDKAA